MRIIKRLWSNRPFRTFLQGFVGVFAGIQIFDLKDLNVLKTLVISGLMAGISAVMSLNTGEQKELETQFQEVPEHDEEIKLEE